MNSNPKSRAKILLIVGIIALAAGFFLNYSSNKKGEENNKANIEIAQNATNAQDAARQIAANNQSEVAGNTFGMFFLGIGGAMTLLSIIMLVRKDPNQGA